MNLQDQYQKQLKYYEHLQYQLENYTDLSENLENPNDSIQQFANILFFKKKSNLGENLSGLLIDENMDTADIFCMILELIIYGLNILTNNETSLFDITDATDDIIYTIKSYLKSTGFDMEFHEIVAQDDDPTLYRDKTDYYYEIVPKPQYIVPSGWYVLNYRIIHNNKFIISKNMQLRDYKAFLISKSRQIFTISFKNIITN